MTDPPSTTRLRQVSRVFVISTFSDMRHERNALQEHVDPKLDCFPGRMGFNRKEIGMTDIVHETTSRRVFLSYARDDDEAFVKRLYSDLKAQGFTVWFDRESLLSRGLTFHQEIKDAIRTEVDRVVYVGGPKAALSQFVREEWQSALEYDHVVVTPILRLGDYESCVPGELGLLHCEDFRDDAKYATGLAKLVASLNQPNPKLGAIFAVPNLPPNFLGRPELMRRVRDALLVDLQKPQVIASADAKVGMQGMGGIGKSVLAAALARNREVRQSYPDGVVWISCGQHLSDDDLLARLRDFAKALGGDTTFASLPQGQAILRELLQTKAVLLVLDDVWHANHAQVFDELGPRCRMLVTTRDKGILDALHGDLVPVSLFTETEAMQLLADAVSTKERPVSVVDLPPEAAVVVKECGCLPLALALCGGMAKAGHSWKDIVEALREADLKWPENREEKNEQHRTIWNAMTVSYDALEEVEKKRFVELVVFNIDQYVPEAAAQTLWKHTGGINSRNCSKLLITLSERSLIQLDQKTDTGGTVMRRFRLHDLLHDYAVRVAGEPRAVHRTLLDAYRKSCPDGWSTCPNDGYFFQNLCQHLASATGNWDEVVALLCDLRFVETRCRVKQVFELIADYRLAQENLPEAQDDLRKERERQEGIARWTTDLIAYAGQWSAIRDRQSTAGASSIVPQSGTTADKTNPLSLPFPQLPTPPPSCRMLTEEDIHVECERIIQSPTRRDRLEAFWVFVSGQCYPLFEYGQRSGFVAQHAFNTEPVGAVHDAAVPLLAALTEPYLIRRWSAKARPNPMPALLRTLSGHSSFVSSVSVTPDGRRVVTGSGDQTARVWDLESGECLRTLSGHNSYISSASVTPDGRRAVTGSGDQTARVWDVESGECLRTLKGHNASIECLSVTPDGRRAVTGSWDKTVRVWDVESGVCLHTLEGHSSSVCSVSVTPDGRRAVTGSADQTVRVWDVESGVCLRTLSGHSSFVSSVSVTPDGRRALTASWDKTMKVWDVESGACLRTLEEHSELVTSVSVTPDGRQAVTGSGDQTARVWDLESGKCLRTLKGHSFAVLSVSVTPDGRRVVTAGEDKSVRVWDVESGTCLKSMEGHSGDIRSVSVTPDGRRAMTTSSDKTVRVWDVESGECVRLLEGQSGWVWSLSVMRDGRRALTGASDQTVWVWDLESGVCLRTLAGHSDGVTSVSVTPDGRRAVTGSGDQTARVWDVESGECLRTLKGHNASIECLSVTPDGRRAVTGSWDKTVRVWDVESGVCLHTLEGHSSSVRSVSVTPDGRRAVTGASDQTVRVWDVESGVCLRTLAGHSDGVTSVSVTPDGRRAVTGSWDKTVRVWDLESGACLEVFLATATLGAVGIYLERLVVGLYTGEVLFAEMCNIPCGPAILTVATSRQARCPACSHEFAPSPAVIAAIQERGRPAGERSQKTEVRSQNQEARPDSSFADPRLLSACPHCQHSLQFNPFYSAAEDYADVLRRGLEFSRIEKGEEHEETQAHLVALVVHLRANGKPEEAAVL